MKKDINKSTEMVPKVVEFNYGPCLSLNGFSLKIEDGKILPDCDFLLFPNFDNDYIIPIENILDNEFHSLSISNSKGMISK